MGVDSRITLPGNVRVQDVADIIGILGGLEPKKRYFDDKSFHVTVPGVKITPTHAPYVVEIQLTSEDGVYLIDGEYYHSVLYFFEHQGTDKLMNPPSTAFWISIGRRLVDFFGGKIDYNDCDNVKNDYSVPYKSDKENQQSSTDYHEFQERIISISPLTEEDLDEAEKLAAYCTKDSRRSKVQRDE